MDRNLGDPGLCKGALLAERYVVHLISTLLHAPGPYGSLTAGGSEANLVALWALRKLRGKGMVIACDLVHHSVKKACNLLGLPLKLVPHTDSFTMDLDAVEQVLQRQRVTAVVATVGHTCTGTIDPIWTLSKLCEAFDVPIHVDAALYAFILPFVEEVLGIPPWDFRLPQIMSMTADPHKFALAPIPSGSIIVRNPSILRSIATYVSYLAGGPTFSWLISGTRPGASAYATLSALLALGYPGLRKIALRALELAKWFANELEQIPGVRLLTQPVCNIVAFTTPCDRRVWRYLRHKRRFLSLTPTHLRVVIMPHVKRKHLEDLLQALRSLLAR